MQQEIRRLAEICEQKHECDATYARLLIACKSRQLEKTRDDELSFRLNPIPAREYLDAIAERDRLRDSQGDWTNKLSQAVAEFPALFKKLQFTIVTDLSEFRSRQSCDSQND
jgi:hypothetical protein